MRTEPRDITPEEEAAWDYNTLREEADRLREALRELHDYALKEITRPSAHHDPVWAKVADVLAGETSYGAQ